MSKEFLCQLEEELAAIPDNEVRSPDLPVQVASHEALFLKDLAQKDWDRLTIRNLDRAIVESLAPRAHALQEAETRYVIAQFGGDGEVEKQFKQTVYEAIELRDELLHGYEYAFDGNEELLAALKKIKKGGSYADLVQDQSHLEGLGKEHRDLIDKAGIPFSLVERCGELKIKLAELLAKTSVEKLEKSSEKKLRDRAFTLMDQAVNKVRKCGKSVFFKDPDHAAHYASAYHRKLRRKYSKVKEETFSAENEAVSA